MIEDRDIEQALDFLRDNAIPAAQARANRVYLDEYRKTLKAQIMKENAGLAIGAQEREAYADARYVSHLEAIKEAVFEDERFRFLIAGAEAKISAWQTQSRIHRAQDQIR